jgi:lysozyme family protein
MRPEDMVSKLSAYQENSKGTYRGISRSYYPKWEGWEMLESGISYAEIEKAVERFYISYYFYQMKLDLLEDDLIAFTLFNFAVSNGKKKAFQKLQVVTGSTNDFINTLNSMGKLGQYKLLLELLEFYQYTGNGNVQWLYSVYRAL